MDFADLARLASGHLEARVVQAAVELGVFDALNGKSLDASSVAAALSSDRHATELLLDALTALELLRKAEDQYSLTVVSETYLLNGASCSYTDMIRFDASLWKYWEKLAEAVRRGKPVTAADMYQDDPRETERFVRAMDALVKARGDADVLARLFDWDHTMAMLDIGSGPGTYPIHLCRLYPKLHVTIFDLPGTLKVTRRLVEEAGLENRIRLIAGDYRTDAVPGAYPIIFMSNIIHAESHEDNERLISKLASNLQAQGQILVKDHILDDRRTDPPVGALFSMLMVLTTRRGRCYSFNEVKGWLEKAGLTKIAQINLPPPLTSSIVVGTKPSIP
jgi:predicted O-methyltransferase YrrM